MTIISPQKTLKDFKKDAHLNQNNKFLIPVYEKLFQDFSRKLNITKEYRQQIKAVGNYFQYLRKLKKKHKIQFTNQKSNKREIVEKFIKLIRSYKTKRAASALSKIVLFLAKNRRNINGLQIICWTFFNETSLDEIRDNYLNNEEGIKDALLSFDFLSLFIESENFAEIALNDLLIDIEIKNPTRRKGMFDKLVFERISKEIKKTIPTFKHNPSQLESYLKSNNNWLIDETLTRKIDFPLPSEDAKLIDVVCKVNKSMLIGSHKEQKVRGGAQDNQAKDARAVFAYKKKILDEIKKRFDVEKIYLCVILEAKYKKIKSSHWNPIFKVVSDKRNENKYLLNAVQFIELIKNLS